MENIDDAGDAISGITGETKVLTLTGLSLADTYNGGDADLDSFDLDLSVNRVVRVDRS